MNVQSDNDALSEAERIELERLEKVIEQNIEAVKAEKVLDLMSDLHAQFERTIAGHDLEWVFGRLMIACIEQKTLVALLVEKGVLGSVEYLNALIKAYGEERS
jgi:hypothetical protein